MGASSRRWVHRCALDWMKSCKGAGKKMERRNPAHTENSFSGVVSCEPEETFGCRGGRRTGWRWFFHLVSILRGVNVREERVACWNLGEMFKNNGLQRGV